MQTSHLDIYRMTAERTGKQEDIYKAIGTFVFQETAEKVKNPTSLILKLKGVGSWHLRKKRMEIVVNEWEDRSQVRDRSEFESDTAYNNWLEKHIRYINFVDRLAEYEDYLTIKKEVRTKRYETQVLLEPTPDGDKYKSGQ